MESIEFINKVWIPVKGRILDRSLNICAWVCLALNVIALIMGMLSSMYIIAAISAMILIAWTSGNLKSSGEYINTDCKIIFFKNQIIWEYPSIDLHNGMGRLHARYTIDKEAIIDVAMSNQLQSVRLKCRPVVDIINRKSKMIDYKKKHKSCILILYNYDINRIKNLYEKYLGIDVKIID